MEDQERLYDLICNSNGLKKAEIKKTLKLNDERLQEYLDSLYRYGFIDLERGIYRAVPEEKIPERYVERNVDLHYLKDSVDMKLVEVLWRREYRGVIKEIKEAPKKDLDWKISNLERKMKVLESLHKSFKDMKRIK